MQRIPASATLGRLYADQDIGYSVLTLTRDPFSAFTQDGVTESLPGLYVATVNAPDAGGYIQWGLADKPIAESSIDPVRPDTTEQMLGTIRNLLADAIRSITSVMPKTPVVQMDMTPVMRGLAKLYTDVSEIVSSGAGQQAERVSEIQGQINVLSESYASLHALNSAARQVEALTALRDRINGALGDQQVAIKLVSETSHEQLAEVLETVRADVDKLSGDVQNTKQGNERKMKSLQALDKFMQTIGGDK